MNDHDLPAALPALRFRSCARSLDGVSRRLIRRAARNTPPALAQRLEEEWLADMTARATPIGRLRLALGCWWAASVIAHEYGATALAAAGSGTTATAAAPMPGFLPRRTAALVLIASLHLALVYFLALGFTQRRITLPPSSIQAGFPDETPTREPPPPLNLTLSHPKVKTDDLVPRDFEAGPPTAGSITLKVDPSKGHDAVTPPKVDRVPGGPGARFPAPADYYPDASRRLGETGAASVQVCVDAHGRLASNPSLAESSGRTRLDAAALALAKAGSGYYRATTEDGRPVSSCFPFRIRFRLSD